MKYIRTKSQTSSMINVLVGLLRQPHDNRIVGIPTNMPWLRNAYRLVRQAIHSRLMNKSDWKEGTN